MSGILMFVYIKKEKKRFHIQIKLLSSGLNKIKQILYCRALQSLQNTDLHSESLKGESTAQHFPQSYGTMLFWGRAISVRFSAPQNTFGKMLL